MKNELNWTRALAEYRRVSGTTDIATSHGTNTRWLIAGSFQHATFRRYHFCLLPAAAAAERFISRLGGGQISREATTVAAVAAAFPPPPPPPRTRSRISWSACFSIAADIIGRKFASRSDGNAGMPIVSRIAAEEEVGRYWADGLVEYQPRVLFFLFLSPPPRRPSTATDRRAADNMFPPPPPTRTSAQSGPNRPSQCGEWR